MRGRPWKGLLLGLVALLFVGLDGRPLAEADSGQPPLNFVCTDSDRFGVWHPSLPGIEAFDVEQLHAGWWNFWTVLENPSHAADMRFVQLVRIAQGEPPPDVDAACFDEERDPQVCPTWDEVGAIAQLNPGSLWLIGNEPDRQDYVEAGRYAEIYHDFYTFLKAEDPTSQVGIGGVVQPTPIRLEYLDDILQAYQALIGVPMPVDVWNVHNYVLREKRWYEGCPDCWGCDVPPGSPHDSGMLYGIQDHDDIDIWTGHLTAMRQWMHDRGYRDRPLIVSEFGILMPEFYGYDYARVRDFMLATFEWMMTATDSNIGYPADGERLVQAWSWYGLAESGLEGWPLLGHLFDPDTKAITPLGVEFGAFAAPLTAPFPGSVDLRPTAIWHSLPGQNGGDLRDTIVTARVYNGGAAPAEDVLVRFMRDGEQAGEATIPSILPGTTEAASVRWTGLTPGQGYEAAVTVSLDGQTVECNPYNNTYTTTLVLGEHWIYLPVIKKRL